MMTIKPIYTDKAPKPIGPYSQAMDCGNLIFLSGQIPLDPSSGEIVGTTITEQAEQVMSNMRAVLQSQGLDFNAVAKATVFMQDLAGFGEFNAVYEKAMNGWKPARSVVEVARLPKNVLLEIEAIACR